MSAAEPAAQNEARTHQLAAFAVNDGAMETNFNLKAHFFIAGRNPSVVPSKMNPNSLPRTFASIRFVGDRLEPAKITAILHAEPTVAYRAGEIYKRNGRNAARGRRGLWMLSSEYFVSSSDLNDHLKYLVSILFPDNSEDRVTQLHTLMRTGDVEADVGCFWMGSSATHRPVINKGVKEIFKKLPAHFEKDFHMVETIPDQQQESLA